MIRPRFRLRLLAAAAAAALAALALAAPAMASPASPSGPVPGAPASVHFSGNTQLVHVLRNSHLPRTHLPKGLRAVGRASNITQVNSRNWSGYADQACGSCKLRFVNVSFAAPSINCTGVTTDGMVAASVWDGLDGFASNSTTVEQVGVVAFCNLTTPVYTAFFEMFPQAPFMFNITGFGAGDAVNAEVYFDGTAYHIAFNDYTQGVFMNTVQACPSGSVCQNNSAEVIAEDPLLVSSTGATSFAPLADFGQAFYSTATVTARDGMHGNLGDTSLWSSNRINMVNGADLLASPSGLLNGFTTVPVSDFTDTWHASV
ncbi:MAG TPA: G1 family glutamic endopeptidase [Streptosporangiaceae bacterium]